MRPRQMRAHSSWVLRGIAALALLGGGAEAQLHPRGGELQVNQSTLVEVYPAVAAASDGDFTVAWVSESGYFFSGNLSARRFDELGAASGGQFQVDSSALAFRGQPAIASTPEGRMIVVWHGGFDDSGLAIRARWLDAAGNFEGPAFAVNAYTVHNQSRPAVAVEADGNFIVVWESYGQFGSGYGIVGRRFDSTGAATTPDFRINSQTIGQNQNPTIAALPNGEFVVAWSGKAETSYYYPIFARRFDATGTPQAIELQVSGATETSELLPAVAAGGDGGFVVVWQGGAASTTILARRFDASDIAQVDAFPVSSDTSTPQARAAIAMDAAGSFVVAWENDYEMPGRAIFARHFGPDTSAIGSEFQVNVFTTAIDRSPSIATDGSGHYVIAWHRGVLDPDTQEIANYSILVRRFADSPATLDVDGDGSVEALTDAILVLRFAFGFRGAVLIASAVGASCTRCDAGAIEAFLAPLFQ